MDHFTFDMPAWLIYVAVFVTVLCVYGIVLVGHRVYFSPLSHIPGPKLAAATSWYEVYYDLVKGRQFPWRIREMHAKYGPVVRVNPREVHIEDPDYFEKLLSLRLDKDPWFTRGFGLFLAAHGTVNSAHHRIRRGALNKFFSKASIASRTDIIQDKISVLCDKLEQAHHTGEIVQLDAGFICLTVDIITEYAFGRSYGFLDKPGFDKEWKGYMEGVFGAGAILRPFPWLFHVMTATPVWMLKIAMPALVGTARVRELVREQILRILASRKEAGKAAYSDNEKLEDAPQDLESAGATGKATIFEQILDSPMAPEEKEVERLTQECFVLNGAGSETTGRSLYLSTVHLLLNPKVLTRMRRELETVMPDPTSKATWAQLEQLPYLSAVVKESLRLNGGTVTRLSRVSPKEQPITYKDYAFPAGTPVSVTPYDVLVDTKLFPDPETFDPLRWVAIEKRSDGSEVYKPKTDMDKYLVSFSRGPRNCAGMWLAWAELFLTMASVWRRFDFELYETDVEDVAAARDCFTCFAKKDSRGVRVKVTGVRQH